MPTHTKNKWLTALVILLLLVNGVTIAMFWMGRGETSKQVEPPPPPLHEQGSPASYLIRELGLDSQQQQQYLQLVTEHQKASAQLRRQISEEKDRFFGLLRQSTVPDSVKKTAATTISRRTEALDLLTFDHFQKVRTICTPVQQEKFDRIIQQVTAMMAGPKPGGPGGPPPDSLRNGPGSKKELQERFPREGHPPRHRPPPPGDFPPDGPPPPHPPHGDRPPPPGGPPPPRPE